MVSCKKCGTIVPGADDRCPTCGADAGFPNVRAAEEKSESDALSARYDAALEDARKRGRYDAVIAFDGAMRKTFAVVNVDLMFLLQILTKDNLLYSTYQLGVRSQTRKAADPQNDQDRLGVEGTLFGSYGEQIRYAALSHDGSGLDSYEPYAISLKDLAVEDRATLLEENSYLFVEHHNIRRGRPAPFGYRATWGERHKLAVAKLGVRVSNGMTDADFAHLLLSGGSNRISDQFIEVHIYGPVDNNAIASVRGKTKLRSTANRALATKAKKHLSAMGRPWIEA